MPDWNAIVRRRLTSLRLTGEAESVLVEEVALHLEDRYRELCAGGALPAHAYSETMAELDDLYPLRVSVERNPRMPKMTLDGFWKDLRFALRGMRRSPLFVLSVVVTLGLGIGANTTVFTLINTLLLHPLPVERAGELAAVAAVDERSTSKSQALFPLSYADLQDYRASNRVFGSLAGYSSARGVTWQNHGVSQGLFAELVTANYFSTLGLSPARGRFFAAEEDGAAGSHPLAVLNYATWQKLFGGAPDIVGRDIVVNGTTLTIIGVAPPHFIGVNAIFGPDLWSPAAMAGQLFPNSLRHAREDRAQAVFLGIGRLKPGVNLAQAGADISSIAGALAHLYPTTGGGRAAAVRPVRDVLLASGSSGSGPMVFGGAALAIVVGIVLLIACSNVANLLLARSAARRHEIAVRLAMGASRGRLVRQLLTESVLLGLVSGAAGVVLAYGGLQFLFGRLPQAANFPTPKLDGTVLLFALAVSLATGFLFGTIPALKASASARLSEELKETGRNPGRSRRRVTLASALLVGQVAFSFLLLVTAALFLRSISHAYRMDPGFQTAHLAVFPANPGQAGLAKPAVRAYYRDVRDRVSRLPGVESLSWASNMPLWASTVTGFQLEGWQGRSRADQVRAVVNTVDRDYFETAGVPIKNGRPFVESDQESSQPVAIVSQAMARDYWQGNALGRRIRLPGETVERQVVGVARTANYTGLGEAPQACVYVPLAQKYADSMVLYVRSKRSPEEILLPAERELRAASPGVLIFGIRTGEGVVDGGLFQARMGVALLTIFGLLALGLASIGLYGVLSYSVSQRRREIGLRMALGASPGSVLRLVLREGMTLVTAGALLGLVAALAVGQLLSRMLFGVGAGDPLSLASAAAVLAAVATLACYLPARGATRVDPLEALREP